MSVSERFLCFCCITDVLWFVFLLLVKGWTWKVGRHFEEGTNFKKKAPSCYSLVITGKALVVGEGQYLIIIIIIINNDNGICCAISTRWLFIHCFQIELEFRSVDFCGGRKTGEPGEKPSEQGREPTTNSTHVWHWVRESYPGHLRHPIFVFIYFNFYCYVFSLLFSIYFIFLFIFSRRMNMEGQLGREDQCGLTRMFDLM